MSRTTPTNRPAATHAGPAASLSRDQALPQGELRLTPQRAFSCCDGKRGVEQLHGLREKRPEVQNSRLVSIR